MTLLALGFSTPLGLLALLSLPAIVALHLFRRRFRERQVAGLFLFAADALPAAAGRTRARLLRTPSLWLELLAAFVVSLWLGGFHLGAGPGAEHVVVVLDDSASMSAVGPNGARVEEARRRVRGILDDLGTGDRVTLIKTGPRPALLADPRAPVQQARTALDAWAPGQPAHDPARAFELALDLAKADGQLVFVTDREDLAPPPRFRHVAVGLSLSNAAIVSARRFVRSETEERVFADLMAWGERPLETTLRLEAVVGDDVRSISSKDVTITPGRTLHLAWTVPLGAVPLRLTLGEDALAADNVAWLVPEPRRVVPVHVALDEKTAADLQIARVFAALPAVRMVDDASRAALRFGESTAPSD